MTIKQSIMRPTLAIAVSILMQLGAIATLHAQPSRSDESLPGRASSPKAVLVDIERMVLDNRTTVHVTATSEEGIAEGTLDGTSIQYGDGYRVTYRPLL